MPFPVACPIEGVGEGKAVIHGHVFSVAELQHGRPHARSRRSPKQRLTTPTRERPSNQASNNHHQQQWTPADTDGRCFPGQAGRSPGRPHRALASGRRGQRSDSRCSTHHDPCLVQRDSPVRSDGSEQKAAQGSGRGQGSGRLPPDTCLRRAFPAVAAVAALARATLPN